jgi:hypothetical protein
MGSGVNPATGAELVGWSTYLIDKHHTIVGALE